MVPVLIRSKQNVRYLACDLVLGDSESGEMNQ